MVNELITQQKQGTLMSAGLTEYLDSFFMFLDVRQRSRETYHTALKQFLSYLTAHNITNPTRQDIIQFRDEIKATHKPTTTQLYITAIRLFFSWLETENLYKNIANKIKGAKIQRNEHKKDYLTAEQSKQILSNIDTTTLQGKRDKAIIGLMITTGLRTIEIIRADREDLATNGGDLVLYVLGKGRDEKAESVKVAPQVADLINDYLNCLDSFTKQTSGQTPLFISLSNNNKGERLTTRTIRGIVKDCMKKTGLNDDRHTAHSLRHTAGTLALLNGANLGEVKQMLRHTNINTTMIYAHDIERAKNTSELKVANAIF